MLRILRKSYFFILIVGLQSYCRNFNSGAPLLRWYSMIFIDLLMKFNDFYWILFKIQWVFLIFHWDSMNFILFSIQFHKVYYFLLKSNDLNWIFNEIQWILLIMQWFNKQILLKFKDFYWYLIKILRFSLICHWNSKIFIEFS